MDHDLILNLNREHGLDKMGGGMKDPAFPGVFDHVLKFFVENSFVGLLKAFVYEWVDKS